MNISQPQPDSLSESDLDLLSAYLDNQLGVSERVTLERRLSSEPRLRADLEDLRATVGVLHDLEPARPPRSFTLDPATAPRRAAPLLGGFARWIQLGSGFAGLALVLLASAQLFLGNRASAVFVEINSGLGGSSSGAPIATTAEPFLSQAPATAMEAAPAATEAPTATAAPAAAPASAMAAPTEGPPPGARQPAEPAADSGPAATIPQGVGGGSAEAQPTAGLGYDQSANAPTQPPSPVAEPASAKSAASLLTAPGTLIGIGGALLAIAGGFTLYRRLRK